MFFGNIINENFMFALLQLSSYIFYTIKIVSMDIKCMQIVMIFYKIMWNCVILCDMMHAGINEVSSQLLCLILWHNSLLWRVNQMCLSEITISNCLVYLFRISAVHGRFKVELCHDCFLLVASFV